MTTTTLTAWFAVEDAYHACGSSVANLHPVALQALSNFVRGAINVGQWLQWSGLTNSDNLALGQCVLQHLNGFAI